MSNLRTPLLREPDSDTSSLSSTTSSTSQTRAAQQRKRQTIRYVSYFSALLSCVCANSIGGYSLYGHLFQERLHYTQIQVNLVAIAAELAMYLPVSLLGYACDRFGPAPLSFLSAVLFGLGYLLAAFTYRSGADEVTGYTHRRGWPMGWMVLAFVCIGMATVAMYLSAVTTCAKNFGKGKYRGIALSLPIAAFGLSSMWQSQVGSKILYERGTGQERPDVDVFKFFLFLGILLPAVGLLGTFLLKIVNEVELIEEAVEELERSGLLEDSPFFRGGQNGFGSIGYTRSNSFETRRQSEMKAREEEEARKKHMLLNEQTRLYLKDHTMWLTAAGFFFVSGPGEAFINNLGTIIGTLTPSSALLYALATTSSTTHISIVAITSTIARILAGTLTDVFCPSPTTTHYQTSSTTDSISSLPHSRRTISRVAFLIITGLLLSLGEILLATGLCQNHPERFWIISLLNGIGYGAIFSLTPLIVTVIWGVENFGTNWGIVAMMPAFGATVWGLVYSGVYQWAAERQASKGGGKGEGMQVLCHGRECYESTFWAMAFSVWIGCGLWMWAWKGPGGWSRRGIAV